jgi:DNA-directed RNA polymerase specialized sigma24 family protein
LLFAYDAPLGDVAIAPMDAAAHHALSRFLEVLGRLQARDRTAFVLRYVEKMRSDEIASMLDISVPTARRRFTRALGRLRFHAERDAFLADYVACPAPGATSSLVACR